MPNERYIGDGVYASLDPAHMIVLRTNRGGWENEAYGNFHWIALEPEVLRALVLFAYEIGWGSVINDAIKKLDAAVSDEEYAQAEEDAQRKRDAAEGFSDE